MLLLKTLSKEFYQTRNTTFPVIKSLSLTVKKGEVYGFLGPNGAGKTTTVKMIAGLLFPDKGSVTIGKYPAGSNEAAQILGFMQENPQFYRYLRASEVLEFVGELFGLEKEVIAARSNKLLQQVGLEKFADIAVRNFSKGMHQRLAFAVALMNDPELLVLDEPLDGLDPLGRLDFKKLMATWKKEGRTIFFSSHILSDAEELCDRVGILQHGQLLAEGKPRDLIKGQAKTLEEYFVKTVRQNA
ncbi:MAG: ABC transporter ATP-binding protein [Candidatus Berkelbacteria bacterium]|nr:MAG: ABC transporter ATP-binding protein [Candidatus Berkelbacteria bacterium]QQG51895.1 MAG: ABC transporter ATP-binding protein [Candidatus Berkelbacteria bacterium]